MKKIHKDKKRLCRTNVQKIIIATNAILGIIKIVVNNLTNGNGFMFNFHNTIIFNLTSLNILSTSVPKCNETQNFCIYFLCSQFEIIKFRKGDDDKDLSVNGKMSYFRILIKKLS